MHTCVRTNVCGLCQLKETYKRDLCQLKETYSWCTRTCTRTCTSTLDLTIFGSTPPPPLPQHTENGTTWRCVTRNAAWGSPTTTTILPTNTASPFSAAASPATPPPASNDKTITKTRDEGMGNGGGVGALAGAGARRSFCALTHGVGSMVRAYILVMGGLRRVQHPIAPGQVCYNTLQHSGAHFDTHRHAAVD